MRNPDKMSRRYFLRWLSSHRAAGGWDGPRTVAALEGELSGLYAAGASASVAGLSTARSNGLHSALETYRELAAA